jgi:hypothetical protein
LDPGRRCGKPATNRLSYGAALEVILVYRMIEEELPPLMELISEDILSKKCHINLGPMLNIYRATFVIGNALL